MARGGSRPGAGRPKGARSGSRKPKATETIPEIPNDIIDDAEKENLTPLDYMLKVMNTSTEDPNRRDRMAIAAAPFCHRRASEKGGKKEEREKKAGIAGAGRFGSGEAPKLIQVKKQG